MFTLNDLKTIREAFTSWLDACPDEFDENGKHKNPDYQAIIDKLDEQIAFKLPPWQ